MDKSGPKDIVNWLWYIIFRSVIQIPTPNPTIENIPSTVNMFFFFIFMRIDVQIIIVKPIKTAIVSLTIVCYPSIKYILLIID